MMNKIIATCLLLFIACVWIPLFSSCAFFRDRNPYLIQQNDAAKFIGAIRPYRGDSESHYSFGCYLQERNKHELAVEEFIRAVEIKPIAKAYNGMGVSYDSLREYAKAIEAYNAALMMEPKLDYVYNNLGYTYLLNGELESAIKYFKQAVALKRGKGLYHNNLGLAYAMSGKYNLALDEFKLAVGEDRAHASLAKIIGRNGLYGEAARPLAPAPMINPPENAKKGVEPEKILEEIFAVEPPADSPSKIVAVPESQHENAERLAVASMITPVDRPNIALKAEETLADIFSVSEPASTPTEKKVVKDGSNFGGETENKPAENSTLSQPASTKDEERLLSESQHEAAAQFVGALMINPSDGANTGVKAEKILADIFSVRQSVSTQNEERVVSAGANIGGGTEKKPAENLSLSQPVINKKEERVVPESQHKDTHTQNPAFIKIEVSNGNGVNRMARRVGEFLRGKGFLPSRLTNAENFKQLETRIYYSKGYQDQACKVASCLPEGHRIEMVQRPPKGNEVIRVVIGRDLVPYRALFQKG